MKTRDRLRIAAQKSGRLSDAGRDLLARCGLRFRESRDRLFCYGESEPVDLLLVRDDDIPGLIAEGVCDLGIVGRNVLTEQTLEARGLGHDAPCMELQSLGFGRCRLSIAVPQHLDWQGAQTLAGTRVATSYPELMKRWLVQQGVDAEVVTLSGSVEIAPKLGKADAICDLVSTGATLAANQLREVATVLESEAVLAGPVEPLADERGELVAQLLRRMSGVLDTRDARLLLMQVAGAALAQVLELLPEGQPPTVTRVEGVDDRLSLQALCRGRPSWQQLEAIKRAGASGLMVLPVEQMLA